MSAVAELAEWSERAKAAIPPSDRQILLSPARLTYRFMLYAVHRHRGDRTSPVDDVAAFHPEFAKLMLDLFRILGRYYYRLDVAGVENVPKQGPILLVGNHNGALLPTDGFFTATAIADSQGHERRFYALVHDFLLDDPILRFYARRMGMLRAGHESARHAFAVGGIVLVYPGSDLDAFRSFRDRNKVVLGGRKGFLKLALREQVPIVPVVSAGTHEQLIILTNGQKLAQLLHLHEWARTEVLPIALSFPWGLTSGFLPYLPLPAQTSIEFGKPMQWPDLGPEAAENPAALSRCYEEVEQAMQSILDRLAEGRRFLLGKKKR